MVSLNPRINSLPSVVFFRSPTRVASAALFSTDCYRTDSDALAPFIRKGAYVGVDTAERHPVSGELFAVAMPPEGVVFRKRWLQPGSAPNVPGLAILRAESPDYPESALSIHGFGKVVIGRLAWALQAY